MNTDTCPSLCTCRRRRWSLALDTTADAVVALDYTEGCQANTPDFDYHFVVIRVVELRTKTLRPWTNRLAVRVRRLWRLWRRRG